MKKLPDCIAPILMGAGLWIIGNSLLSPPPASGQEVASNFVLCVSHTDVDTPRDCPHTPGWGTTCAGSWQTNTYGDMTCSGPSAPTPCTSSSLNGSVPASAESGYCREFSPNGYTICIRGSAVFFWNTTKNNPPWCSNPAPGA